MSIKTEYKLDDLEAIVVDYDKTNGFPYMKWWKAVGIMFLLEILIVSLIVLGG